MNGLVSPGNETASWYASKVDSNITAKIFVGTGAQPATYIISSLRVGCDDQTLEASNLPVTVIVNPAPTITCEIPSSYDVPFGTKDKSVLSGATNLGQAQSDVALECSSNPTGYSVEGKAKFNVTGDSNTYQGNNKWLSMKDSTPADTGVVVTGVWGASGESPCDAPDSSLIAFDGTAPHTITLGEGSKTFPITWGLCNKGTGWPSGEVKASATLTIDWD